MLKKSLEKILDSVEGSLGAVLIGIDGLPIAEVSRDPSVEISVLGAELTTLYKNGQRMADETESGSIQEISIVLDKIIVICRAVTQEYFLLLAITPEGLAGKGRYQLKKSVNFFYEQLI